MSTEPQFATDSLYIERDVDRKIRHRNKLYYRFNHWPIWIFVFFIAPGPLTFDLFERGFDSRLLTWLGLVLIGTAIAGLRGKLPGCEPRPYIIRFTEDRPNPLYRRVCYTTAWGEVVAFAVLNIAGLTYAVLTGEWRLKQMYEVAYFPIAGSMWFLGALGYLPRVKRSTKGEGHERRYFYGSVWAVAIAQPILWFLWKVLPHSRVGDGVKLVVFVAILVVVGQMSLVGPRPPLPEEVAAYPADLLRRLLVKPGMTGLWQVSGRANLPWEEAVRLDLCYVENWTLSMDLVIMLRTLRAVVRTSGAY